LDLPNEWIWEERHIRSTGYKESKTEPIYFYGIVRPNTKEDKLLHELWRDANMNISAAYVISNIHLAQNFSNHRKSQAGRMQSSENIFFKQSWKAGSNLALRDKTIKQYRKCMERWNWNRGLEISDSPILVAAHGTSASTAWKIVASGFAALSTLDDGFYGNGMYFSSECIYTVPYLAKHPDPAIILCLLIPGNPYPVIESPTDEDNLRGSPIISGYQCHYVVTKINGYPFTQSEYDSDTQIYDEIVVNQEAQVLPIMLIELDPSRIKDLITLYQRQIPKTGGSSRSKNSESVEGKTNGPDDEVVNIGSVAGKDYMLWKEEDE